MLLPYPILWGGWDIGVLERGSWLARSWEALAQVTGDISLPPGGKSCVMQGLGQKDLGGLICMIS